MGTVHDLLEARGKQAALEADIAREVVEAAASYLADEANDIGFIFSGWTQAALPHKKLADDQIWQITSEKVTLLVEPGRRPAGEGLPPIAVGVPYGSRARLIMLYLQTEALRTGSREVALGKSLRIWLGRMGISSGGKSIRDVREQAERISRCRLTFHFAAGPGKALVNQNIVDAALFLSTDDPAQGSLFLETANLSEVFFEQLKRHPVPLEEAAIRAISNNSLALDIYCWLAYRLHALTLPRLVTWKAMKGQFGGGFTKLAHFKHKFQPNLVLALAVYRDAKVEVDERGVTLHPSRPPVAPRLIAAR
jgi:Plasmid encoded RepA protein